MGRGENYRKQKGAPYYFTAINKHKRAELHYSQVFSHIELSQVNNNFRSPSAYIEAAATQTFKTHLPHPYMCVALHTKYHPILKHPGY